MATEQRYFEMRADVDNRKVEGTAVRYGDVADIGGLFRERIESGALRFNAAGTMLNVQHRREKPVARTNGGGLQLNNTNTSLEVRAELVQTRDGDDALTLIRSQVLKGLSVEMHVKSDKWNRDYTERTISDAVLVGIGIVDFPAYSESTLTVARAACLTTPDPELWRVI